MFVVIKFSKQRERTKQMSLDSFTAIRTLTGEGFFLISKVRVAPKLSEAMMGFFPSDGSSSLCQSTLSFSFRYRLQSRELKA